MKSLTKLNYSNGLVLLCLSFLISISSFGKEVQKSYKKKDSLRLILKPNQTLNYRDTHKEVSESYERTIWTSFKVINHQDSIYKLNATITRVQEVKNDVVYDSQEGFYLFSSIPYNVINYPLTVELSEKGLVRSVTIPDSILFSRVQNDYPNDIIDQQTAIFNIKSAGSFYKQLFQLLFFNQTDSAHIHLNRKRQLGDNKAVYVINKNTIRLPFSYTTIDNSDSISRINISEDYFLNGNTAILQRFRFIAYNEHTKAVETENDVVLLPDNANKLTTIYYKLPCSDLSHLFTSSIDSDTTELRLINTFKKDRNRNSLCVYNNQLTRPEALYYKGGDAALLIEPEDSLVITDTSSTLLSIKGKGALKNKLYQQLLEDVPDMYDLLQETPHSVKNTIDKWTSSRLMQLKTYRDSLSSWAYELIASDIYYAGCRKLFHYYTRQSKGSFNADLYKLLIADINLEKYQSISSYNLIYCIKNYIQFRYSEIKKTCPRWNVPVQEDYFFSKVILPKKLTYIHLSHILDFELGSNDVKNAIRLMQDYTIAYKDYSFNTQLNRKYQNQISLGNGCKIPDCTITDINNKNHQLSDYMGKYVVLMFLNSHSDGMQRDIFAYQNLKEKLPDKKFELITVFLNPDKASALEYIKKQNLKGIVALNPDWENKELKLFHRENALSYYTINPDGIIIQNGGFGPTEELIDMIVKTVEAYTPTQRPIKISQATLRWLILSCLFIVALIVVFVIVFVYLKPRKAKRNAAFKQNLVNLKLSAVRSQLNPHFLFNALGSIQFLVNQNNQEKANYYLAKFSQLMRKILIESDTELVALKDELDTIENYLALEKLRYGFQYKISVAKEVDQYTTETPVMLIQPFVENAVVHGVASMGEQGVIEVLVSLNADSYLQIDILDNGKGLHQPNEKKDRSNGKGISLVKKRIDLMIEKYKQNITFKVTDRKETDEHAEGTRVQLLLEPEN